MGAEFNFEKLNAKTIEDAIEEGAELIEQAAYDYGHAGYSGSFAECTGVKMTAEDFDSEDAAREWLLESAQKWGPMLLVSVKDTDFFAGAWCSS